MTMNRSRTLAALSLLAVPAALAAWHFAQPVEQPVAPESPASTPASAPRVEASEPRAWGLVGVLPCRGSNLIASGEVVYGCRDAIDAVAGRYLFREPPWHFVAAVDGDLVVHVEEGWRVTRLSTGEVVARNVAEWSGVPRRHGHVVWGETESDDDVMGFEAFDLASMSRVYQDFRCASFDALLFGADGEPACVGPCESGEGTCIQRAASAPIRLPDLHPEAGDAYGPVGDGRLWVLKDGTLRWMNIDGTDHAAFEPCAHVRQFGVLAATEDRVLAWLTPEDENENTRIVVFSRDSTTNRWQASAPLPEPIDPPGRSPYDNPAQILDSGRIAFLAYPYLYLLAEGGTLATPPPPSFAIEGMDEMTRGEDGIYRDGEAEYWGAPETAAMFVRRAAHNDDARTVDVTILPKELFANFAAAELSIGLRNAVLPDGFSSGVRVWNENGARRWRMRVARDDCTYDATAHDVLERADFFEVRTTHLGSDCQELEGEAADACLFGSALFGPVPADAEIIPGLPDSFEGDDSLSP